jgi:hypothetical protein
MHSGGNDDWHRTAIAAQEALVGVGFLERTHMTTILLVSKRAANGDDKRREC